MTVPDIQQPTVRGSHRVDPHTLSPAQCASVRHHPSSNVVATEQACPRCGFQAPATDATATAILAIPDVWASLLHSGAAENTLLEAARLRDELHVVANRISRVLAVPGSAVLAAVRIDAPTAWKRPTSGDQLVALLRFAAERLAAVLTPLSPAEWRLTGRAGSRSLAVRDLALIPLHRSHARLTNGRSCL